MTKQIPVKDLEPGMLVVEAPGQQFLILSVTKFVSNGQSHGYRKGLYCLRMTLWSMSIQNLQGGKLTNNFYTIVRQYEDRIYALFEPFIAE